MEPVSPCIRSCCLDNDNVCLGCGRTVEEIVRWGEATDSEKFIILTEAKKRRASRKYKYSFRVDQA